MHSFERPTERIFSYVSKGEISDFEEYVDIIKNRNAERNQDSYEKIKDM